MPVLDVPVLHGLLAAACQRNAHVLAGVLEHLHVPLLPGNDHVVAMPVADGVEGRRLAVHLDEGLSAGLAPSVKYHVNSLVDDALGVVAEEVQDVRDLHLVGQALEPNAVPPGAGSDELLGNDGRGQHRW